MVKAEGVGVQIELKVLRADRVVNPINASLGVAPQAFHVVDVGGPVDVLPSGMLDGLMGVAELAETIIRVEFVCVDGGAWGQWDMLLNDGEYGLGLYIGGDLGDSPSTSFHQANDDGLACCASTTFTSPLAADVGFVGLYFTKQGHPVFSHQSADLGKHTPRRLVGNSQLTLKLFGGDTCSCLGHKEYGIEPRPQGRWGLVEDSVGGWRDFTATELTTIGLAPPDAMVFGDASARLTENPTRPTLTEKEGKARIIIRELGIEGI